MRIVSRHPLLVGTASLLLAAASLNSCQDFLEEAAAPQGTLNELTLANRAGVEGTLTAAYRALDWNNGVGGAWGNTASNWVWGSVTSDDAYKGSEASDQPPINDIEAYVWSTGDAETYLNEKWRGVYEGVARSNATLRLLASVRAEKPGEITDADARSIEGEALFLRAHFHFEAWRLWGNIPYYREDDTDFRKANLTSTQVVDEILADLNAAIALLPTAPRSVARISQWTAKAYKGRVEAYDGRWAAALTTLREVRQSGPYALETSFDRVWTAFAALENGRETILAYQAAANDGEPNGNNANYGERLNFPHGGSHSGCCGFHQPSQNLVNFFAVDAAGLPLAMSDPNNWNARNTNLTAAASAGLRFDPRLDWTVGRDGVPYKDWGAHAPTWIRSVTYGGFYSPKKNAHELAANAESSVGWVPTQLNSVNIHIFRYADLLLLLAEAEVEAPGGNLANAHAIVNEIRTRAAQRAQGAGTSASTIAVPINDPSITWAVYAVSPYPAVGTQPQMQDRVRTERRLELAMEGQRFFDLKRWGIAHTVIDAHLDGVGGGNEVARLPHLGASQRWTGGASDRHYRFPIPSIQIELSKVDGTPRLTQNTGW